MNTDLIVIENAIPKEDQDKIEALLLGRQFPWYYQDEANYEHGELKDKIFNATKSFDAYQLAHMFVENGDVRSPAVTDLMPIFTPLGPVKGYLKIKANLTNYNSKATTDSFCPPHVDQRVENSKTAVYYVNDSSGDTFIFNEEWADEIVMPDFKNLTIKQRVTPKKGTLVIFKSTLLHSGNCPHTNDPRVVVNINFLPGLQGFNE
jgi:hypothetical protein